MSDAGSTRDQLHALAEVVRATAASEAARLDEVAELAVSALREGHRLFFCGNGGSAADAQHLAAEYVIRFRRERRPLPALALTVDSSVITAGANDFGFETVFSRQIEALGQQGDVLFLHSTSGHSPNLLAAAEAARGCGMRTVAFLAGDGGALRERVDLAIVVPTGSTARAQELHLAMGHIVCDRVDHAFTGEAT